MKLSEFHFQVNPNYKKWDSIEGVIQGVNDWEVRRHDLGYDTDGMVIKSMTLRSRKSLAQPSRIRAGPWLTSTRRKRPRLKLKKLS